MFGLHTFFIAALAGGLKHERPTPAQWQSSSCLGIGMLLVGQGGVAWSEQYIASGLTALFIATIPLWVVLLSRYVLGTRLTKQKLAGLFCGFFGLIPILNVRGSASISPVVVAVLLCAALGWALSSVYTKRAPLHHNVFIAISMQMICGGIGLLGSSALCGEWQRLTASAFTPGVVLSICYLTILGGVIAYSAFGWLLRYAPPAVTSMFAYISPVVAVVLGACVLHEPVTANMLIGGAVILSGVILVMTAKNTNLPDAVS